MAKQTEIEGYSVIVYQPVTRYRDNPDHVLAEARTVRDEIIRHVDGDYDRTIDIEPQVRETCEHCGAIWSEDSDTYNGGCCDEDEKAQANSNAA